MQQDKYQLEQFKKRRIIAGAFWVYLILLLIATIILGTFFTAFVASIKDDALSEPGNLSIPQLSVTNWTAAASLGNQGGNSILFGGFKPESEIEFYVTYAVERDQSFITPVVTVPRRSPGSGMAAIAYPDFAADFAKITSVTQLDDQLNVNYIQKKGIKEEAKFGKSRTWKINISYQGYGPDIDYIPLTILTPRDQVLIDSTLPPTRTERRGRINSWSNISPGVLGYVFRSYFRVWNESVSIDSGKSLFVEWTLNSFFIAIAKMLLTVIVACMGGYALARIKFVFSKSIFLLLIVSMTVPMQVSFISNYEVFNYLDLLNTPWAVILMLVASAQVLIMKQFFETLPKELEESAIVDGASPFQILIQIFIPLAKPAIASVAILGFQGAWNDFFWPLVVITSPPDAYTLTVGLLSLRNSYGVAGDWNLILAGSFLSIIPVLIIFIFFQKYFTDTNVGSSVKG